jgi:hypothetical protein
MTHTGWMWLILTWMSLPAMVLLAGILLWRRLHREFPLFFWYLVVTVIATLLRFAAQFGSVSTYFYTYWISEFVVMIFNFLAVYELFVRRIFPRFQKVRFYLYLFPSIAFVIIILGWFTALVAPNKGAALLIESRVLDFILVAVLLFFVFLMMVMGRQWTKYDFGIAFGFAINAAAFLVTSAIWVRTNYRSSSIDQLPLIAYDISCLVWLYCFSMGEQLDRPAEPGLDPKILHEARGWESMLKSWLAPGKNRR